MNGGGLKRGVKLVGRFLNLNVCQILIHFGELESYIHTKALTKGPSLCSNIFMTLDFLETM